jgi:hypothetical protein
MKMDTPSWYNYDTGEHESAPMLETDENAIAAVAPWPGARELYRLYREMGDDIVTAFLKVSHKLLGEEYEPEA